MVLQSLVNLFGVWDYVVFSAVLAVSAGIGLYYACAGGGQKTTSDFLMGGRQMGIVPISLSLLASFLSAITLLGTPVEVYQYGTQYFMIFIGYCFVIPTTAYLYMPVFYGLGITSAYEYLERRFNSVVRKCGSAVYIFQMVIYLAIVMYAPALALNQVTGLHVWGSVAAIAVVCTFYTTVGGMKAVMWTDAFQIIIMFGSMLAVVIKGTVDLGGFDAVWQKNLEGQRIEFLNFDPNPLVRHTFWTLGVGGAFTWLSTYAGNQAQIQRYLTSPTLKAAQIALWWNLLGLTSLMGICCFGGLILYARYWNCDPMSEGVLTATDQMFPLFVMESLGTLTGLPGLFVAGIFSGALSTISSGLNSLAAVTLEDFVRPLAPNMKERKATIWSKSLALSYGVLVFALVAVAEKLGNVLQAALSIFGMIGGPILGLFTLGIFFPWANSWGAGIGLFSSLAFVMWIGVGTQVVKPFVAKLPISTDGCGNDTDLLSMNWTQSTESASIFTFNSSFTSTEQSSTLLPQLLSAATEGAANFTNSEESVLPIYHISYMYYSAIAVWTVVLVGLLVSCLTGLTDPRDVDPKTICPIVDKVLCCLPAGLRKRLRCNVGKNVEDSEVTAIQNGNGMTESAFGRHNPSFDDQSELKKHKNGQSPTTQF